MNSIYFRINQIVIRKVKKNNLNYKVIRILDTSRLSSILHFEIDQREGHLRKKYKKKLPWL